ncbi:MAG: hypothetical protein EOO75_06790 [Myxococcales bacterium]|nr:MAG: hypothetical protein EOO75_06790 [Myxococcales bacterium]
MNPGASNREAIGGDGGAGRPGPLEALLDPGLDALQGRVGVVLDRLGGGGHLGAVGPAGQPPQRREHLLGQPRHQRARVAERAPQRQPDRARADPLDGLLGGRPHGGRLVRTARRQQRPLHRAVEQVAAHVGDRHEVEGALDLEEEEDLPEDLADRIEQRRRQAALEPAAERVRGRGQRVELLLGERQLPRARQLLDHAPLEVPLRQVVEQGQWDERRQPDQHRVLDQDALGARPDGSRDRVAGGGRGAGRLGHGGQSSGPVSTLPSSALWMRSGTSDRKL